LISNIIDKNISGLYLKNMKMIKKTEKNGTYTERLKRILDDDVSDIDSSEILNAAYDSLEAGDIDDARDLFLININMDGHSEDSLNGLAIALCENGEPEKALVVIKKAVELYGDDAITLANMGTILAENGKFSESVEYYEKSISADPYSSETYLGLIDLYVMFGNPAMAFLSCRRAQEALPEDPDIKETMAQILIEIAASL